MFWEYSLRHATLLLLNSSTMFKIIFFLITLLFLCDCSLLMAQFSQEEQVQIDSLNLIIKENKHDTAVAHAYIKLSEIMYVSNLDTMIFLCEEARTIAEKNLEKSSLNLKEKRAFQRTLAMAVNNIGYVYHVRGDYLIALEHFLRALDIYQDMGDKIGLAHSYNNIGAMYNSLGEVDKALEFYKKALDLGQELGDKQSMAYSLNNIGFIYKKQGKLQLALEYYHESLKVGLEIGIKPNIANTYNNIGVLYRDLGEYQSAMANFQNALNIQEEIGHKKGMASTLGNMGHLHNLQGNIPLTLEFYNRALKIREEIGAKSGIALSLSSIGTIHENQGNIDLALEYYQKSLEIQEEIGEKSAIAKSLSDIGSIHQKKGDLELALEYYKKSLLINEDLKNNQGIAGCLNDIGTVYNEMGNLLLSLDNFQKSLKIYENIGEKIGETKSIINIGSIYQTKGDYINAVLFGKKALSLAQELGAVKEIEKASELLFNAYKNTNRYNNALKMHELFIAMRDSLLNEENTRAAIVQDMNYKHEKELQAERLALAEQKHKEELAQQKRNQLTYGGYSLIIFFGIFGYLMMRSRQRKKELIRQQKHSEKLEQLDKLKDQFLANTSHELRTPLQGIIGLSESLYDREKDRKKRSELAMITSSGKRLSSLVNSILDFSKLKTHELILSIKGIDLRTVTDAVFQISQPLLMGKPVRLVNEINPSTPLVDADEERVYQILHNLIGNAIKFTSEGEIEVAAIERQDMVQICVKDTGIGIPEDKMEDIFKSFEQVDSSDTREYGGTGLGLTITRQLVELHGGNIWIESAIEEGTRVFFTLPRCVEAKSRIRDQQVLSKVVAVEGEDVFEEKQQEEKKELRVDSGFNILIVDDEPINQQVLSNHLSKDNFRIHQAMNGQEALELLEKEHLDLVLLDIMMPKMSGYEVCCEIRKKFLPSELPVIMITAKDQVPDLVEGLASGANDYLAKPFSKDELLARLKTHLNLYNINSAYLRFVPKEFIRALGHESIIDVKLGDQVQDEMTILFSDIRFFTTITEKLSAKDSFEFLNEYLSCITPAITSNGGFIDKYIGDAVMALFPYKAEDAIIAAIRSQKNLEEYNAIRKKKGLVEIKIGIGIHTGELMMGTIGVKSRMDGTVISDAVNLASRLEELNKRYGTSMIISEDTLRNLSDPEKYHYRFLSKVSVSGKEQSNSIYEFFDGDTDHDKDLKIKTLSIFNAGIAEYYHKRFTQASVKFQEVLDIYPEDRTAQIFLKQSAKYMVKGVPDDWDGVDVLDRVL